MGRTVIGRLFGKLLSEWAWICCNVYWHISGTSDWNWIDQTSKFTSFVCATLKLTGFGHAMWLFHLLDKQVASELCDCFVDVTFTPVVLYGFGKVGIVDEAIWSVNRKRKEYWHQGKWTLTFSLYRRLIYRANGLELPLICYPISTFWNVSVQRIDELNSLIAWFPLKMNSLINTSCFYSGRKREMCDQQLRLTIEMVIYFPVTCHLIGPLPNQICTRTKLINKKQLKMNNKKKGIFSSGIMDNVKVQVIDGDNWQFLSIDTSYRLMIFLMDVYSKRDYCTSSLEFRSCEASFFYVVMPFWKVIVLSRLMKRQWSSNVSSASV